MALGQFNDRKEPGAESIVIGESLVDIVKKPDNTMSRLPGGSPANIAVALTRLGRAVTFATYIGSDEAGEALRWYFDQHKVTLAQGSNGTGPSDTATCTLSASSAPRQEFSLSGQLPEELPAVTDSVALVHIGSPVVWNPRNSGRVTAYAATARKRATVSFAPHISEAAITDVGAARKAIQSLIAVSDIVKVSEHDANWLAPEQDPLELAQQWLSIPDGPLLVLVTAGTEGLVAMTRHQGCSTSSRQVTPVDTSGCDDAAVAATLDGLWRLGLLGAAARTNLAAIAYHDLQAIAEYATDAAAITSSRTGADSPEREELVQFRSKAGAVS